MIPNVGFFSNPMCTSHSHSTRKIFFHVSIVLLFSCHSTRMDSAAVEQCLENPAGEPSSSMFLGASHNSHVTVGSSKNADEQIGEEHSPEGLLSTFGLGEPRALMTSVLPSFIAPSSSLTKPLSDLAIDYGQEAVAYNEHTREIALTFDHRGGARWRSCVQFEYGTFTVKIKTPEGNTSGLNTNIYLSSLEGDKSQDEIDFEFLGKDKGIVQTNYYTMGTGDREEIHQLGFDSSLQFHEYTIRWLSPSAIEWLVDGKLVRRAEKKDDSDAYPAKPMYLYASVWDASDIDEGRWAGPYIGSDAPYVSTYREVGVPVSAARA